jgi:Fe-S-cluster containining protein
MTQNSNFKFLCKLTGKCCIHNQVILNSFDIFNIAIHLNVSAKFLFQNKIITYIINKNNYWMDPIINLGTDSVCPFLKSDSHNYLCEIHSHRPTVCRIFPLNYNFESKIFNVNDVSRERCLECFDNEINIDYDEFFLESDLKNRIKIEEFYREFIIEINSFGYNLKDIVKNDKKKKVFFKIQEILYEKYPGNFEKISEFPWDEIKLEILDLIHFS